jgi:anti-anti-sigma factor
VLLGALESLRARGGRLSLVSADEAILRVFEVTGLHRIFEIRGSRAEALPNVEP